MEPQMDADSQRAELIGLLTRRIHDPFPSSLSTSMSICVNPRFVFLFSTRTARFYLND